MPNTVSLEGFGSGGASLNFKVVGGLTQPSNPKENTIWVNTEYKISGWVFSSTEPNQPADGTVWFITGASSQVEFNALKKNTVMIYPVSAKQYISGAWVNVTAKSYKNGELVEWIAYLYNSGDSCVDLTGGYTAVAMSWSSSTPNKNAPTVTNNDDHMLISQISGAGGAVYTEKKIDLSGFKTLYFDGMISSNTNNLERANLSIWSDIGTYKETNRVAMMKADNLEGVKTLDISSLTGEYHIGFYLYNAGGDTTSEVKLNKMWLE